MMYTVYSGSKLVWGSFGDGLGFVCNGRSKTIPIEYIGSPAGANLPPKRQFSRTAVEFPIRNDQTH